MSDLPMSTQTQKTGFSLIEVIGALALIALVSALAVNGVRLGSMSNFGAGAEAQRISLDLQNARRRAIATGDNHVLRATRSGAAVIGYAVERRNGSSRETYTEYRPVAEGVAITISPADPEFTFEGDALQSYTVEVRGPEKRWRITVSLAGGGIAIREL